MILALELFNQKESGNSLFSPALLKITNFYCYFWYANFKATFDVYVEDSKLEANCGGDYYIWTTQEDGFYLYNMFLKINLKMHDWNK